MLVTPEGVRWWPCEQPGGCALGEDYGYDVVMALYGDTGWTATVSNIY